MKRSIQIVLAAAAVAAVMSFPLPARSDCIHRVQLATAVNTSYTGQEQDPATAADADGHNTGLLPTTSTAWSGVAEASGGYGEAFAGVNSSIDMGDLSINLALETEINTSTNGAWCSAGGSSQISWVDELILESSTLPYGAPVDIRWHLNLTGALLEGGRSYPENGMHARFYYGGGALNLWNPGKVSIQSQNTVGDQLSIQGDMEASAIMMANYGPPTDPPQPRVPYATVDINIQAVIGIEILTPGVTYSTCSGTVYPIPEPVTMSMLAMGGLVVLRRRKRKR
ncbi:MAG: PEP-CTERM sorting domain-containing protein [Phycisphaerae bacterium]|jgi:hypothetical protein|nr:PEP-CTERM sorting domain-containing protein [Phycisphaerae bacterium]